MPPRSWLAALPAILAALLLAAPIAALPAPGMVALCTGEGIRYIADPGAPRRPAPLPDCAKICHLGTTRRKLAGAPGDAG